MDYDLSTIKDNTKEVKRHGRHLQEYLLVSHPYVESRVYADIAKPLLEKKK